MEYLSLSNGHLASIMMPLVLLFNKIIDFQAVFFNRRHEKKIICLGLCIGIIGVIIFHYNKYGNYFCFIWVMLFSVILISQIVVSHIVNKINHKNTDSYSYINNIDKIISFISIVCGLLFLVIPFSSHYNAISGGNNDIKVIIISKAIFVLLGLSYVFLNKLFVHFIYLILKF